MTAGVLAAIAGLACAVGLAGETPEVRLLRPALGEMLVGPTEVVFLPLGVDDEQIDHAVVTVDGRTAARVESPPWRATIDLGEDVRELRIEVTLVLRDGRVVRTGRTYPVTGLRQQVEVRLVNLALTALDRRGRPVRDLRPEDVEILDDGQPVTIERWSAEPDALAVALVIDGSGSMSGERLAAARAAARAFLDELPREVEALVVRFADTVEVLAGPTRNRDELIAALGRLHAEGGTALYDAVVEASRRLAETAAGRRRAMLLLSDGQDLASSGLEPGSFHTLDEAIRAAHRADVEIFAVGIGGSLDVDTDFSGRFTAREVLERLSASTGGRLLVSRRVSRLRRAFEDILRELLTQYTAAYRPPPPRPGQTFRRIEVRSRRRGVEIRTREGYFVH
ncbi:MAG: hypothetical protein Kow0062_01420 [Acidobacteriota bacterium]